MKTNTTTAILVLFIVITLLWACGGGGGGGNSGNNLVAASSTQTDTYRVSGLNFSPYIEGQDPDIDPRVDEAQLLSRMEIIKPYTRWIRTYGSSSGLEKSGMIGHSLGLKVAAGAWISRDLNTNELEIENLITIAKAGEVDMLIVGSEVLYRRDLNVDELIGYINRVKKSITSIPVTYADRHEQILAHPAIIGAVDVVLVNYYPYWEGVDISQAAASIHQWHQQITTEAQGKPVIVSETGWPSDGEQIGKAVASLDNASFFFLNFVSWARANNVDYFYFEAFDEDWKVKHEGPQGAHWGIWDKFGNLKSGMEAVFNGKTVSDNWNYSGIPCGIGEPSITFTFVPPKGSFENLRGEVCHVKPLSYKVAVYIYVSGWWTKPYFDRPLTSVQIDGNWTCDITTGGVDQRATRIVAFLVPADYQPPLLKGDRGLPSELEAFPSVEVVR